MNFEELAKSTNFKVDTLKDLHSRGMLKGFLDMVKADQSFKKDQQQLAKKVADRKARLNRPSITITKTKINEVERVNKKQMKKLTK